MGIPLEKEVQLSIYIAIHHFAVSAGILLTKINIGKTGK